ncbi:hypothetical protein AZSI13_23790 [Azospira sp. I13]|uniref:DUF2894 domain-containing protein n=1 Tax=Azospira sp. I13 TaxID=1765050 RepID=UPI000D4586B2|nr:DUF2894 domain-containing protein [Azospira sp. I13]GBG03052.1 hypothetical protein AZSI13_23790 [Azospira sp. I13]
MNDGASPLPDTELPPAGAAPDAAEILPAAAEHPALAALARQGAAQRDPLRYHFITTLARRSAGLPGPAKARVEQRLAQAIADCQAALQATDAQARDLLAAAQPWLAGLAAADTIALELQGYLEQGDHPALRRRLAALARQVTPHPLAELRRQLAAPLGVSLADAPAASPVPLKPQGIPVTPTAHPAPTGQTPDAGNSPAEPQQTDSVPQAVPLPQATAAPARNGPAPVEDLKAVRYFKESWAQLSLEQQLTQALAQMPENAGPLNSHMLALRALILMRDQAPAYLHRFMGYLETLLWLEGPEAPSPAAKKSATPTKAKRKPRARPTA